MAEYYTVYCHDDLIYVVRANPPPTVTLSRIPILDVINLETRGIGSFIRNGITIYRIGNQVSLSGTNGNLAPAFGTKTFSLSPCIEHNGGQPERPANRPPTITAESRFLFISVNDTGSFQFRVNDLDHDDLTLSIRLTNPDAVAIISYPNAALWDASTQQYASSLVVFSNSSNGDQTGVIVTVTDTQGASATMTFTVIAPGRPDSFGPFSHLADLFFQALTYLLINLCGIPVTAPAIVIPIASIGISKRRRKRNL
jgi:hypothetical protein